MYKAHLAGPQFYLNQDTLNSIDSDFEMSHENEDLIAN